MADTRYGGRAGTLGRLVFIADMAGTYVFAAEGALTAAAAHLDLLGLAVLALVTALGGGIIRDVLLGAVPPASLLNQSYVWLVLAGAATAWASHNAIGSASHAALMVVDAAGLALFTVAGAEKALQCGSTAMTTIMMSAITATGGGVLRDLLVAQVPLVLRADVYATAALAGAAMVVAARRLGASPRIAAIAGGGVCFGLRLLAVALHWNLPRAG